jgi:hypothetical protein
VGPEHRTVYISIFYLLSNLLGQVYTVRNFDVDRDLGPLDLLARDTIYGEHVVMFDHIASNYGSYDNYQTSWRSIQVRIVWVV